MTIRQFRYSSDNLGYLVYSGRTAVAIDGGAVEEMVDFARSQGLTITAVTNTHSHPDHTQGNRRLLEKTGAGFLDCRRFKDRESIDIEGFKLTVLHTPGHMDDCVTFQAGNALITGDTLFNGTVGNCFSGDLKAFYNSIVLLMSFPDTTLIYGGHDYVREAMAFARTIEPENPAIDRYLAAYDPSHIVSTLADERQANLYLRFNEPSLIRKMQDNGLSTATGYERWESLMELY